MNSLIVDYLTACHYQYTLSVFQPEAGLSGLQTLSQKDMLQLMHIGAGSPLQAALSKRGASNEGRGYYATFTSVHTTVLRRIAEVHFPVSLGDKYTVTLFKCLRLVSNC